MLLGTTEHRGGYGASAGVLRLQIIIDNIMKIMQSLFYLQQVSLLHSDPFYSEAYLRVLSPLRPYQAFNYYYHHHYR